MSSQRRLARERHYFRTTAFFCWVIVYLEVMWWPFRSAAEVAARVRRSSTGAQTPQSGHPDFQPWGLNYPAIKMQSINFWKIWLIRDKLSSTVDIIISAMPLQIIRLRTVHTKQPTYMWLARCITISVDFHKMFNWKLEFAAVPWA